MWGRCQRRPRSSLRTTTLKHRHRTGHRQTDRRDRRPAGVEEAALVDGHGIVRLGVNPVPEVDPRASRTTVVGPKTGIAAASVARVRTEPLHHSTAQPQPPNGDPPEPGQHSHGGPPGYSRTLVYWATVGCHPPGAKSLVAMSVRWGRVAIARMRAVFLASCDQDTVLAVYVCNWRASAIAGPGVESKSPAESVT